MRRETKGGEISMAILVHGPKDPDPEAANEYDRFQSVAGGLRVMPEGLIAHIAVEWDDGFQVMGIWESREAEQKAHNSPRVLELRKKMNMGPLNASEPVKVRNIRARDFALRPKSAFSPTRTSPVAHHVALSVADLDASVAWYLEKLGFLGFKEVTRVDPVPGASGLRMVMVGSGTVLVELLEQEG